jgi:glycosyltransferase involved in cell wall biosynthesis
MNDPPRLKVVVIPAWYPTLDRPMHGIFIRDQVRAVAQANDVAVIADDGPRGGHPEGDGLRDSLEQGIRTIRVTHAPGRSHAAAEQYLCGVFAGLKKLSREGWRPDVIHGHVYYTGLIAALAKARYRAPIVVSEHSSHFLLGTLRRGDRLRARVAFALADLVCPVSLSLQRAIRRLHVLGRFEVVPNPIDLDAFKPSPFPASSPPRALVVAGLQPVKDIPNLLAAVASLAARGREFRVDIVGDGPERGSSERQAHALGLSDRVKFHGYRTREQVAAFLRESHFLVVPSRAETFGVAMIEALAAGRPVVATDVGVASEVVSDAGGVVVPAANSSALAAGIDEMLRSYSRSSPHALAAAVTPRFSYTAVGGRWDEIYRELVSRSGR